MSFVGDILFLDLGTKCNNDCYFCVVRGKKIAVLEEGVALAKILDGAEKGIRNVVFSGGESTLRECLISAIDAARDSGYLSIQVQTNGRTLSDIDFVRSLKAAGVTEFSISLHGSDCRMHEKITRVPGSFRETLSGIANVRSIYQDETIIATNTVITYDNLEFLHEVISLLIRSGVPFVQMAYMHGQGAAAEIYKEITPPMSAARPWISRAIKAANRLGYFEGKVTVEAYPYCFLKGVEGYSSDVSMPRSFVRTEDGEELEEFVFDGPRAKADFCAHCTFDGYCHGPWRDYPEAFGWDEFVPIRDRLPEDCIPGFLLNRAVDGTDVH